MGIPKFAAWLTKKYPDLVLKQCPPLVHGLYIDMNGIIHPCCHSEDDPSISMRSEAEKIEQICLCVQQLVESTKPTSVLYLAMDGVAPRAKMNQQRSRRYMASVSQFGATFAPREHGITKQEREEVHKELKRAKESLDFGLYHDSASLAAGGGELPSPGGEESGMSSPQKSRDALSAMFPDVDDLVQDFKSAQPVMNSNPHRAQKQQPTEEVRFDSNCISPGTEFMTAVSRELRSFVEWKLIKDPLWHSLSVVVSDTNSPGEGEHKLIDFIRTQSSYGNEAGSLFHAEGPRQGKGAHVICGLDADLILLCLSLHLPQVYIMRDAKRQGTFHGKGKQPTATTGKVDAGDEGEEAAALSDEDDQPDAPEGERRKTTPAAAPPPPQAKAKYEYFDVDVIGDSIVSEVHALTAATGFVNQWKVPTSEATAGGIVAAGGYRFYALKACTANPCTQQYNSKIIDDFVALATLMGNDFVPRVPSAFCGESAMDNFLEVYARDVLPFGLLTEGNHEINLQQLGRFFEGIAKVEAVLFRQHLIKSGKIQPSEACGLLRAPVDEIWRQQYYSTTSIRPETIQQACQSYIEGIRFVWRYYSSTSETCSWSWYYPYHHAPFCTDVSAFLQQKNYDSRLISAPALEKNPPPTFAQLLCILPPTSSALLPEPFRNDMWHPPESLIETFPSSWAIDFAAANGKEHLSTVLLPFANMSALVDLVRSKESLLSEPERQRNANIPVHQVYRRVSDGNTNSLRGLVGGPSATATSLHAEISIVDLKDVAPNILARPRAYGSTTLIRNMVVPGREGEKVERRRRGPSVPNDTAPRDAKSKKKGPAGPGALYGIKVFSRSFVSHQRNGVTLGDFAIAAFACAAVLMVLLQAPQAVGPLLVLLCLSVLFVFGVAGILTHTPCGGCSISRNNIRDAFVDWVCPMCLSLNFMRNERCFQCRAPVNEKDSMAIFTGKLPQNPPPYDADHSAYIQWAEIPIEEVEKLCRGGEPTTPLTGGDEQCDML